MSDTKIRFIFPSLMILFFLGMQSLVTFRVLCPPESISFLKGLRLLCAPAAYPFLDYPMYNDPHYEGERIQDLHIYITLEDDTTRHVSPGDLGINFWLFEDFKQAIDKLDHGKIRSYVQVYEQRSGTQVKSVQMQNHPLILTADGLAPGEPKIVRTIPLGDAAP